MKYLNLLIIGVFISCSNNNDEVVKVESPQNVLSDPISKTDTEMNTDTLDLTKDERIAQIKLFYKECMSLVSNESDCRTDTLMRKEKPFPDMAEMEYKQIAKSCELPNSYSYLEGQFFGHEWANTSLFYYKGDDLFFAFSSGGAEGCGWEYRLYFNKEGEVIKVTEKSNECDGDYPTIDKNLTDLPEGDHIIGNLKGNLELIESILAKEK